MDNRKNTEEIPVLTELVNDWSISDVVISEPRFMCDLEMILLGAFKPLNGFLTLEEYKGVVDNMRMPDGEVFPMPIVLPIDFNLLSKRGSRHSTLSAIDSETDLKENFREDIICNIKDTTNLIVATLTVESIFKPDISYEQKMVLGSNDSNHPYIQFMNKYCADKTIVYIGGTVTISGSGIRRFDFLKYRRSANTVKESFANVKGPIVGFQTRNPMHRAHFELTVDALKRSTEGCEIEEATLLLTPAMGPTQPGDIAPDVRLRCYSAILPYYTKLYGHCGIRDPMMIILPLSMRMAGPREALWHAIIRRNYGCTHFIVGRDHAGPSTVTQEGNPFYGPYEAHEVMEKYSDEIGITPILARMLVYVGEENGGYVPSDEIPVGIEPLTISGSQFRSMITKNETIPEWFGFPEVVDELKADMRDTKNTGLVLYFTGLPSSGKSTLSLAVDASFRENPGERRKTTLLDADIIRTHLSKGLGFSKEDRSLNVRRIGYLASEIAKHRGICLVANIAPYEEDRKYNRDLIESQGGKYIEIHVDTDLKLCESRDVKGLYEKARSGIIKQFTGVDDPYEVPEKPEIRVRTDCSLEESLSVILDYLKNNELM